MMIDHWIKQQLSRLADRILGPAARAAERLWDREVGLVMQRGRRRAGLCRQSDPGRNALFRAGPCRLRGCGVLCSQPSKSFVRKPKSENTEDSNSIL